MIAELALFDRPPRMTRQAKYVPEFLEAMRGRKFVNPQTRRENVFESLPDDEQARIYEQWSRAKQRPQDEPRTQQGAPQEALESRTLVPNMDPNRYKGVDVQYGSLGEDPDQIKEELHAILGDAAKAAGMTPEQLALDLAGGGGLVGELKEVKIMTLRHGERDAVMVTGYGDNIREMDRELFFRNGRISHVHNKILELDEDAPAGTGTRMLATQLASLKKAGGRYIKTTGSGCADCDYVGYYVWPLLGFDAQVPEDDVSQMPRWLREELMDTGGGPPFYISELMSFKKGREWWKEYGSEIELELAVDNDEVLQKYVQKKAKKAGKTVGQFLHNASKNRGRDKTKNTEKVEQAPSLDKDDLQILSEIWDSRPKKHRKKDKTMTTKNATRALVELAKKNPGFRKALFQEVVKEGNINISLRDFAIDEFSQHQMLRNLREGDLIEILFEPGPPLARRIAARVVASDFDPAIPGVSLRGTEQSEELLVDRGQDMPLIWEPGGGEPAFPVLQLKVVHSKLAAEAEAKSDKATAAQVEFAMDLAKEKGKDYSKSDLAKKTKAEISKMIEDMQKEETVASEKQVSYAMSLLDSLGRGSPSKSSVEKMSEVEVSKLIDKLKAEKNKQASHPAVQEILEALGGEKKLASLIGARKFRFIDGSVFFRWPNRTASKGTRCAITKVDDKYRIGFFAKRADGVQVEVAQYTVPKEELASTFEKQTGWFLTV